MKFNFRKITSALASTAIIGSTIALAAAANFPAPFVKDGVADVAIVYGASADLAAVTDVSSALSAALAEGGSSMMGPAASNDAYPLFTSSTPLQLNNSLNSVRTSITDSNIPSVLGDSEFSGDVDATASFQIVLGANPRMIYAKEPTTSSDPAVGLFFGTSATQALYNATVTFDDAVDFTDSDSQGEDLTLFGQRFTVSSATTATKLVLFKSAQTLYLSAGGDTPNPSTTVEINGETYTIELVTASDTSATIRVSDSSGHADQKEVNEAASKKILGVEVAVNSADESTATNIVQAEVLVGADRLTFQDGNEVTVGTDNTAIDGTLVTFNTGNASAMQKFTVQVFAADGSNDFLAAGHEFVDPVFGSFRLAFNGLSVGLDSKDDRENIEIKPSGNDKAAITFTSWEGQTLSNWEFLNNKTGGNGVAYLGDSDSWPLIVRENGQINESAFAVVGNEDEAVLVELSKLTNDTTVGTKDDIEFTNVITGQKYTASTQSTEGVAQINIGTVTYTVNYWDNKAGDGSQHVRLNWPDSSAAGATILYPAIETDKGAKLAFYQPLTMDLANIDGAGTDATSFMLPDGDGYTTVTVAYASNATNTGLWNFTFGTTTTQVNLSNTAASASGAVGTLTYNVSGSGTVNNSIIRLVEGGANVVRPAVVLFEEEDESNNYNTVIIETSGAGVSDNGVSISEASFSWNGDADMKNSAYGSNGIEMESDDNMYVKLDQWGTLVTTDESNTDQYSMMISYPDDQAVAHMYIDTIAAGSSTSTALGNVKLMDSELSASDMKDKNLIVVGGSCVNTAAASLLGAGAGCGATWTAATGAASGQWIIQTFANPWSTSTSKVATLVAGWEQGDTKNAGTYLTTQTVSTAVGTKLTGSTATAATVSTA